MRPWRLRRLYLALLCFSAGAGWFADRLGFRMHGDFGRFQGFAGLIAPGGLDGLRADPRSRAARGDPHPARVTWDRIYELEKRGHSAGRAALVGGTSFALLGGLFGYAIASGFGESDQAPAAEPNRVD